HRVQTVRAGRAKMRFHNLPRGCVLKLFALKDSAGVNVVFGFSGNELHGEQEFERDEADVMASHARLASRCIRLANRVLEEGTKLKASIDEIDTGDRGRCPGFPRLRCATAGPRL